MARRRTSCRILGLGIGLATLFVGLPTAAHAEGTVASAAHAVPLARRTWSTASVALPATPPAGTFARTGLRAPPAEAWVPVRLESDLGAGPYAAPSTHMAGFKDGGRTVAHAKEPHDHFHVTALRLWFYREFLPKSNDADALGIELNTAWGAGCLDFANILYTEVVDYPRAVPGMPAGNEFPGLGEATGVTDVLSALLISPKRKHHGPHHFAAGVAVQLPTATDDTIGSGKWSAGPAVEYEYHKGRLFAAFVALQLWSFAGDSDRKNVNMLMIKPMVTYDLGRCWKAVYMPYGISVYWEKPKSDMIYLPVGGGIQRDFRIGRQEMAVSLQLFQYVLRPSKGAEYDMRLMVEFDF